MVDADILLREVADMTYQERSDELVAQAIESLEAEDITPTQDAVKAWLLGWEAHSIVVIHELDGKE